MLRHLWLVRVSVHFRREVHALALLHARVSLMHTSARRLIIIQITQHHFPFSFLLLFLFLPQHLLILLPNKPLLSGLLYRRVTGAPHDRGLRIES